MSNLKPLTLPRLFTIVCFAVGSKLFDPLAPYFFKPIFNFLTLIRTTMRLKRKIFNATLMLTVGLSMPAMVSCGNSSKSTESRDPGQEQADMKGGGPGVDKSSDNTLQEMIKTVAPKFAQAEYQDAESGQTIKYNLFVPQNVDTTKTYPLVLFIADASTVGDDATKPLTQGYGALVWATDDWQSLHPCYVLVPQFQGGTVNDKYEHNSEVDAAVRLLKKVTADNYVDSNRLYTTGQSMGGMISMYYNVAYPDLFAASIFVDSHWDTSTFDQLVKHKFIYFIAGDKGKAYPNLKPLEAAAEKEGVQYTFAEWSARLPEQRQSELAATMLGKGAPVNIFEFETGSVLPEGVKGMDHMYSFDYAYKIPSVREWLFKQHK